MHSPTNVSTVTKKYRRELCVFINCPFDGDYLPLFNATVFTTVCCGLIPISSLAEVDPSISRLDKLIELISHAKYSLHDLCRCHGEGADNLARLNMSLELGISIGLSRSKILNAPGEFFLENNWFLLVPNRLHEKAYQQFISDLQGSDPMSHGETQESIVTAIMNIFTVVCDLPLSFTPALVLKSLPTYEQKLLDYKRNWSNGKIPWSNTIKIALDVARDNGIIPEM